MKTGEKYIDAGLIDPVEVIAEPEGDRVLVRVTKTGFEYLAFVEDLSPLATTVPSLSTTGNFQK